MKKADLINAIAEASGASKSQTESVLNALGMVVTSELETGGEVTLPALGKLYLGARAERVGRNPQTGEPVRIAAANVPKFKPLKALKDAVNG